MRLAMVGPSPPFRGGIAHYTALLARELGRRHALTFVGFRRQYPRWLFPGRSDRDPSSRAAGEAAERLLAPLEPWTWWRSARRLAEGRPELLIIQWWVPFWAPSMAVVARLTRRWSGARVLFICHNVLPHEGGSAWERALLRLALSAGDAWLLHSDRDERALRELLPDRVAEAEAAAPDGRAIHRALLPLHSIATPVDRAEARRRLDLPAEAPVALFFGFVRPYKGLAHLVDALPELSARLPDLRLLVAGEFWEPAEAYRRRAEALGCSAQLRIDDRYIPNEEVATYFEAADVLVMPYVQATQSGVVTLAIEHGLPIVATRVGGLPEAVEEGMTGLIVPPADPAALSRAILRVLTEPALRQQLVEGVEAARARFSWPPLIERIEVIARPGAGRGAEWAEQPVPSAEPRSLPSASVIIPNLDSPLVDRAVDAVLAQRGARPLEILVVGRDRPGRLAPYRESGNAKNRDGGPATIPIRLIETDGPRLPGAARNLGAAEAAGEVLVFTDADCQPEPDWLRAHLECQAAGRRVVGGAVCYDARPYWSLADNLSMFHESDPALPAGPRPYLPSLNLSVHREAYADTGPMDPELPRGEDLDWSIRAAKAGHRPYFEPAARIWHRPDRRSARAAWDHWHQSGRWMPGVRRRHPETLDAPAWLRYPPLVLVLAPAIAAVATARLYGTGRPGRRHWRTLPAVYLTKLAWCLGACRPLETQSSLAPMRRDRADDEAQEAVVDARY